MGRSCGHLRIFSKELHMITFLEGSLVEKQPTRLVVDVNGVGYEVLVPLSSYDPLPALNERCRILTYDYVREDTHALFGFVTEDERRMFVLLLAITGIGPKLALSALSGLSVKELKTAVVQGDVKRLSSISGVGKKMAERMILELRHRMDSLEVASTAAGESKDAPPGVRDAVLALIALGYRQDEARKMVARAADGMVADTNVEDIIKKALSG
jgi:Holliday junction DNA helicase RuvA